MLARILYFLGFVSLPPGIFPYPKESKTVVTRGNPWHFHHFQAVKWDSGRFGSRQRAITEEERQAVWQGKTVFGQERSLFRCSCGRELIKTTQPRLIVRPW